jgi:two-component system response regulator YesN
MKTKVVIIDDEALVRRGIVSSIPWHEHDIEVIGERSDGKSGLQLIRETKPDIVITDIRMPNMDGLEMVQFIRSEFPRIKILVLSVLEDFTTLREALRLGVDDYINKLTEPEELLERVLRSKAELIDIEDSENNGFFGNNALSQDLEQWLLGAELGKYNSFLYEGENYTVGKATCNGNDTSYVRSLLLKARDAMLVDIEIGQGNGDYIVFILKGTDGLQLDKAIERIEQSNKVCTIGLSNTFQEIPKRKTAFKQAEQALEYSFYQGEGKVFVYEKDFHTHPKRQSLFEYSELKKYQTILESGEPEQSTKALETLFPEIPDDSISPRIVRDSAHQWLSANISLLRDWGGHLEGALQNQSPYEQIQQFQTYSELRQWCFLLHSVICEMLQSVKSSKGRIEIQQAIDYIKNNFMTSLRVHDVARLVNLSENYFSYLFTKETGNTFTQFVQETRIEKAKEFLRNQQYDWIEVGEKVGLEDPKYFSKVFKKFVGMTPVRFQNGE